MKLKQRKKFHGILHMPLDTNYVAYKKQNRNCQGLGRNPLKHKGQKVQGIGHKSELGRKTLLFQCYFSLFFATAYYVLQISKGDSDWKQGVCRPLGTLKMEVLGLSTMTFKIMHTTFLVIYRSDNKYKLHVCVAHNL